MDDNTQDSSIPYRIVARNSHLRKSPVTIQNCSVACASTQVALECLLNLSLQRRGVVPQKRVHGHHKAGSTETTLRAVSLCYSLL